LDSSSTAYFLARRIAEGGLHVRVITNGGPAMQVLAASDEPHIELVAVGGMLRRLTSSYVGPSAVRSIREHFADKIFLSVTGVAPNGMLTDIDELEAAVKRAMLEQAGESILLLDHHKLSVHGRQAITPLSSIALVLADGVDASVVDALRSDGTTIQTVEGSTSTRA
jgi:DeoR/GlpR family transcriptional regulator of sugar metabolism